MLSGLRRVGKTFLVNHFAGERRHVFHVANSNTEATELRRFAVAITTGLGAAALDLAGGPPARWDAALRLVAAHATEHPLLLVIDEFTTLLDATPTFAEQLRDVWDEVERGARHHVMIVLTGSSKLAVDHQFAAHAALHRRPTRMLPLTPVRLGESTAFLPDLAPRELVQAYAICGGFPRNLRSWDAATSVDENLRQLAGTPGGPLVTEGPQIIADLDRRGAGTGRVLRALGHERLAHTSLLSRAGKSIQQPLDVLERQQVIRREVPIDVSFKDTKRRLYRIVDPYLRFWFSVLGDDADAVDGGRGDIVLRRNRARLEQHVAAVFEDECRSHAQRLADAGRWGDGDPTIGRWWRHARDPETRQAVQTEIDVAGFDGQRMVIVGEVKWGRVGDGDIGRLLARVARLPYEPPAAIALWSGLERPRHRAATDCFSIEDVVAS